MFGTDKIPHGNYFSGILVPKLSSKTVQQAVGVVGCIIMPHNVFLHSALVLSRDIDQSKVGHVREAINYNSIECTIALAVSFMINLFVTTVFAKAFYGTDIANSIGLIMLGNTFKSSMGEVSLPSVYLGDWVYSRWAK